MTRRIPSSLAALVLATVVVQYFKIPVDTIGSQIWCGATRYSGASVSSLFIGAYQGVISLSNDDCVSGEPFNHCYQRLLLRNDGDKTSFQHGACSSGDSKCFVPDIYGNPCNGSDRKNCCECSKWGENTGCSYLPLHSASSHPCCFWKNTQP